MLIRWLIFWFLDTTLGQFYNNSKGNRKRKERASYSQRYITENAPGKYITERVFFEMLTEAL